MVFCGFYALFFIEACGFCVCNIHDFRISISLQISTCNENENLTNAFGRYQVIVGGSKSFFAKNLHHNSLISNPTKWSNTLKQFVGNSRRIIWVCLAILWGWHLKGLDVSRRSEYNSWCFITNCCMRNLVFGSLFVQAVYKNFKAITKTLFMIAWNISYYLACKLNWLIVIMISLATSPCIRKKCQN